MNVITTGAWENVMQKKKTHANNEESKRFPH